MASQLSEEQTDESIISGMKGLKVNDVLQKLESAKKRIEQIDSELVSCGTSARKHIQRVSNDAMKVKNVGKDGLEEMRLIAQLRTDVEGIGKVVAEKVEALKTENRGNIESIEDMIRKINETKEDDQTSVNEATALVDESARSHRDVSECLGRIRREVLAVRVVQGGTLGCEQFARIDGYVGKWELVKSIGIPPTIADPLVLGVIRNLGNDEICMTDATSNGLHVTNIATSQTRTVIEGERDVSFTSCAVVDSNVIVCGKKREAIAEDTNGGRDGNLDGYITFYDRRWNEIGGFTIPKNSSRGSSEVFVDVFKNGLIVAAQNDQSTVYIINRAYDKIVGHSTVRYKTVVGEIQTLVTDDFVVKTKSNEYSIIPKTWQKEVNSKATLSCDQWRSSMCRADNLTGALYITYEDKERGVYRVDQASSDGNIQAKGIIEILKGKCSHYRIRCVVSPTGNLVACNGDKFFIYKKGFVL